jgi:Tol biopolymer transport system component
VRDILEENQVTLEGLDRVTPPETSQIREGMTITVTRVSQTTEVVTETLPFGREVVRDASIPEGETRLLQSGEEGLRERVFRVTVEDGVVQERTLVQENLVEEAQDEVVLVGTRVQATPTTITGTLAYLERQDAWVLRNSTANRRRLTALGDLDGRVFALSPSGERLLFTRVISPEAHLNELWVISTTEADAEATSLEVENVLWAGWSPEGDRLAWTTAELVEQAPGWRGQNDLWTALISSRDRLSVERRVLEPEAGGGYGWWGTRYRWSPDEDVLAYARPEELGVVNLRRREVLPLARFPAYRTYSSWAWTPRPTWSPDGQLLMAVLHGPAPGGGNPEESPVFDLWAIEATGAYSVELASEVGMWASPNLSPDGATLLYGRARVPYQSDLSSYTLCTSDRDGSNRACPYPPEDESGVENPAWTWGPDGNTAAFIYREELYLLVEGERALPTTGREGVTAIDWR